MIKSNKDGKPLAESEEGRLLVKENAHQPRTFPTRIWIQRVPEADFVSKLMVVETSKIAVVSLYVGGRR